MEHAGTLAMVVPAVLITAGALLGGAVAHWRRGTGYIITGAIIGGMLMFIPGALIAVGTVYALSIVVAAAVVILLVAFFGFLG